MQQMNLLESVLEKIEVSEKLRNFPEFSVPELDFVWRVLKEYRITQGNAETWVPKLEAETTGIGDNRMMSFFSIDVGGKKAEVSFSSQEMLDYSVYQLTETIIEFLAARAFKDSIKARVIQLVEREIKNTELLKKGNPSA